MWLAVAFGLPVLIARLLLSHAALTVAIGCLAAAALLPLCLVQADIVRFPARSGHTAGRAVAHHTRGAVLFMSPAALVGWLGDGLAGLALVLALAALASFVVCLRVLAYRVHPRRSADWIVSAVMVAVAFVGLSFPPALPIAIALSIGWLWRAAAPVTWRLA